MQKLADFILLFLLITPLFAQRQISGTVQDPEGQPLSYANVLLLSVLDSSLVKGAVSEDNVRFSVAELENEEYLLSVSLVGYQSHIQKLPGSSQPVVQLPPTILQEMEEELEEITVTAKKPLYEKQIDRMVVNVQESITAAGNSVLEVISHSPGVVVNQQNYTLTLNGKSGVMVMINNNLTRMSIEAALQMLEGMSAANVEKIELITNPPANYDAEGSGGIIHIVMRENPELGTNGNFGLTAGMKRREILGANFSMYHRTDKVSLFMDYSILHIRNRRLFINEYRFEEQGFVNQLNSEFDRFDLNLSQTFRTGIILKLNNKSTIGALLNLNNNYFHNDAITDSESSIKPDSSIIARILIDETRIMKNISTNFHIIHSFNTNHRIRFDYDWLSYRYSNPTSYDNDFFSPENGTRTFNKIEINNETPMGFNISAVEYTFQPNTGFKLQAGYKNTQASFKKDVASFFTVQGVKSEMEDFTASAEMEEKITAGYLSTEWTINEKTQINGGIRYEQTDTRIQTSEKEELINRNFGNFFPSFYIKRRLKDHLDLFFSYSRRITRPTLNALSPMILIVNPNTYLSGNPTLLPAVLDGFKLDLSFKRALIGFEHNVIKNDIAQFQPEFDLDRNIKVMRSQNLEYTKISGLVLSIPWIITDWWDIQSNIQFQHRHFRTTHLSNDQAFKIVDFNLNMVNNFVLGKGYSAELSGYYQSRRNLGIWIYKPRGSLNAGFQKKLKEEKGNIRLLN
ncbi:outer membrane beta-barrel family protein [Pleomorphovibrio marinus]|uniref:outer membrane beta-barrel family protein n=1 Tax=Pleomorphovibrio marinus TaxID=2164132 RepID=UPI0018E581DF|nr:outer membrane beta-barrel family protein [Pleomorphovibrio marinus]